MLTTGWLLLLLRLAAITATAPLIENENCIFVAEKEAKKR